MISAVSGAGAGAGAGVGAASVVDGSSSIVSRPDPASACEVFTRCVAYRGPSASAIVDGVSPGAIAVTDHNVFGGALEAVGHARDRELIVIPGEEVKTDGQGEVIGLFLQHEIPRGLSFADTIAAIREQDGIVYVPHPFDRLHAIPDPRTLHRHLAGAAT